MGTCVIWLFLVCRSCFYILFGPALSVPSRRSRPFCVGLSHSFVLFAFFHSAKFTLKLHQIFLGFVATIIICSVCVVCFRLSVVATPKHQTGTRSLLLAHFSFRQHTIIHCVCFCFFSLSDRIIIEIIESVVGLSWVCICCIVCCLLLCLFCECYKFTYTHY